MGPGTYVSISLYLQITVHAGLSQFPSGFRLQKVPKIIFFMGQGCQLHAQPPTWRTRVSHLVWVITLTCLAWEALPVAMLPTAQLSGSFYHISPTTTSKQGYLRWGDIKVQNCRMWDEVRIRYRNVCVKNYTCINRDEALVTEWN